MTAPTSALFLLRDLIEKRTGFHYPDHQADILASKLSGRLHDLTLHRYLDYYYYLQYDPDSEAEWSRLFTALVVPETYFYREYEPIAMVTQELVQEWLKSRTRVRIWHAGCSSGEEPYTMAMSLLQTDAGLSKKVEIVATDLDESALFRARQAFYQPRSLRALPPSWQERYFQPRDKGYQLLPEVRSLVRFQVLNLMDSAEVARLGKFDAIFCRNVFLYFRPETIQRVLSDFHHRLNDGGRLFVGVCETLLRYPHAFRFRQDGNVLSYEKGETS